MKFTFTKKKKKIREINSLGVSLCIEWSKWFHEIIFSQNEFHVPPHRKIREINVTFANIDFTKYFSGQVTEF